MNLSLAVLVVIAVYFAEEASAIKCRACMGDPSTTSKSCWTQDCGSGKACGLSYVPEDSVGTMVFAACLAGDNPHANTCEIYDKKETGAFCACRTDNCNDPDKDECRCLKNYKPQPSIGRKGHGHGKGRGMGKGPKQ